MHFLPWYSVKVHGNIHATVNLAWRTTVPGTRYAVCLIFSSVELNAFEERPSNSAFN